ncbi:MAG: 1-(5-phosphoribosyl)-5-[(5-phosphoribosylamino)methylideneamino] imidazole-4-carboxamide isomerase [Flavobacteriaceae bacterium]
MRVIPAIDIIEGKCVRLSKGDYATKKVYNENPLEVAKAFEAHGVEYLHLVDLDGARAKEIINYDILEQIASGTSLKIDFGGGLNSERDLETAFNSGAKQITGGSIAVRRPEVFLDWLGRFGPEKIILGADAKDEKVAISGWEEDTALDLIPFIESHRKKGVKYVICTDISKDGMLQGPAEDLYRRIIEKTHINKTTIGMSGVEDERVPGIKLIASGGISCLNDLIRLQGVGCDGAILGKAIYENKIGMKELESFIYKK